MNKIRYPITLGLLFILAACDGNLDQIYTTGTQPEQIQFPTKEVLIASPAITFTHTPEPTVTPMPKYPFLEGTLIPDGSDVISSKNASQMIELAQWGKPSITDLKFSPDGKFIAAATSKDLKIYNADSLDNFVEISKENTLQIQFINNGSYLVVLHPGKLEIWEMDASPQLLKKIDLQNIDNFIKYSIQSSIASNIIVLNINKQIQVFNSDFQKLFIIDTSEGEPGIFAFTVSADGKLLAVGKRDGSISTYSVETMAVVGKNQANPYNQDPVEELTFSPDNQYIFYKTYNSSIGIRKIDDDTFYYMEKIFPWVDLQLHGRAKIHSSSASNITLASDDWEFRNFDFTNQKTTKFDSHLKGVMVDISSDGHFAVIASTDLEILSIQDGKTISRATNQYSVYPGWRSTIQWGDTMFGYNNPDLETIFLRSSETGELIKTYNGFQFALYGNSIALADEKILCIKDVVSGKDKVCIETNKDIFTCGLRFSQGGDLLIQDACKVAILYSTDTLAPINQFGLSYNTHLSYFNLFGPKNDFFIADKDDVIQRWNSHNGKVPKVIGEYPNGPLLGSGDGTKLVYHSISSKERKAFFIVCQVIQNEVQCEKYLESVPVFNGNYALSPDGNILAFFNLWSRSVEFWDLQSKVKVNTINVVNDPLGISFSPDGNRILIASNDGFHVWGLEP